MATFYVDPAGSNSNDGSIGTPWLTIQKAADTMVAGDTANVNDGTYTGGTDQVVNVTTSGTSGNPITYKSTNRHGAIVSKC